MINANEPLPYLIKYWDIGPDNPKYEIFVFYNDTPQSHLDNLFGFSRIYRIIPRNNFIIVYVTPFNDVSPERP